MPMSKKQLAILHVAKSKLDLSEEQYRTALVQIADATSATELDKGGFDAMMGFFEYLGFQPLSASGPDYGARPGMASCAQIELIRAMWSEYTNHGGEDSLNKWFLRSFKVSSLRFLTMAKARSAITAETHEAARGVVDHKSRTIRKGGAFALPFRLLTHPSKRPVERHQFLWAPM